MPATTSRRDRRLVGYAVVAALAVLVLVIVAIGITRATAAPAPVAAPVTLPTASSALPDPDATVAPRTATPATSSSAPRAAAGTAAEPDPQPTRAVAITKTAPIVKELTARIARARSVRGEASGPGEIAGPSVAFTVVITNRTGRTIDLGDTVVNAYYGADRTPAVGLAEPGGSPFPASVEDGGSATGVFVFSIPTDARRAVTVTVDTSVEHPVVAFSGSAPR